MISVIGAIGSLPFPFIGAESFSVHQPLLMIILSAENIRSSGDLAHPVFDGLPDRRLIRHEVSERDLGWVLDLEIPCLFAEGCRAVIAADAHRRRRLHGDLGGLDCRDLSLLRLLD